MVERRELFTMAGLILVITISALAQRDGSGSQAPRADLPNGTAAMAAQEARFKAWIQAVPNGSGPYGTAREEFRSLPDHTVFRPAKLNEVKGKLPIVAFGAGGCRNTPIEFTAFLAEIASRGYFIVADGTDEVEFATGDFTKPAANGKPLQVVNRAFLTSAVDWSVEQDSQQGGPFFGKLATNKIAYMGQSCGGMQALSASTDPRTTTTVVLNSGRFPIDKGFNAPGNGKFAEWFEWSELRAPIAYFNGGPKDTQTGHQNFQDIQSLPVFLADLPVGHTGAYPGPDMRWVKAVVAWLDWQLKGDGTDRGMFIGPKCGLCTNPEWTVTGSKNLN